MHHSFVLLDGSQPLSNHYQAEQSYTTDSNSYVAVTPDTTHLQHEITLSPVETAIFVAGAITVAIASGLLAGRRHQ